MSIHADYMQALATGNIDKCLEIEVEYGFEGLPPELVSTGLAAEERGEDGWAAINKTTGA